MTHPTLVLPAGCEPSVGTAIDTEARLRHAPFEGYSMVSPDGINAVRDAVTLICEGVSIDAAASVANQLRAWAGATTFLFQIPGDAAPRKWRAPKWNRTPPDYGVTTLTITLEESFVP